MESDVRKWFHWCFRLDFLSNKLKGETLSLSLLERTPIIFSPKSEPSMQLAKHLRRSLHVEALNKVYLLNI